MSFKITIPVFVAAVCFGALTSSAHAQDSQPAQHEHHDHAKHSGTSSDSTPKRDTTSKPDTAAADSIYTCPMDPEVISKTEGRCPKCGMKLVKRPAKKAAPADSAPAAPRKSNTTATPKAP